MLKLEFPNKKHKTAYEDMMKEWKQKEHTPTSPWMLFKGNNYKEFLEIVTQDTVNSIRWVNSHLFFLTNNDNEILWSIQIRHHINHPRLKVRWWHIGYWIKPSARWKWYATEMLRLWLLEAKDLSISKVLITCYSDNLASRRVIEKNGWKFEKEIEFEWEKINRYWIKIK